MRFVKVGLLLLVHFNLVAQQDVPATEPSAGLKSDYLFPIWPGKPNTLAGSMGELRNTHFHSGLDIRTNNQTGAPVVAVQDGYVSRAVKSPYSYGNVLYITHPDGNTSLYAHLDAFQGRIAETVREEQYRRQQSTIDLNFRPTDLPVRKGDTVALSGNTGSSQGPHLHFDIRDADMNALNPLTFGFPEVTDTRAPVVRRVALRTMDRHSRINGRFGRFTFPVIRTGNSYKVAAPVKASGLIGLEILAHDVMNDTDFTYGINEFRVRANGKPILTQHIDKIVMENTRGILTVMDSEELEKTGHRYYRMYIADGNPMDMYSDVRQQGLITVNEDQQVTVNMKDSYGNESNLRVDLKATPVSEVIPHPPGQPAVPGFDVNGHWLVASVSNCADKPKLFTRGRMEEPVRDYSDGHLSYFILDLRRTLPDSLVACGRTLRFHLQERIPSHTPFTFFGDGFKVKFTERSLFDTLYLEFHHRQEESKPVLILADRTIPLLQPVTVEWKPRRQPGPRTGVYRVDGSGYTLMTTEWINGTATFTTNRLGQFVVLDDNLAPRISWLWANAGEARLRIRDDRAGISRYEAFLDGQWLALNYDYKTGVLFTEKKDANTPLRGELIVRVTDYCGNSSTVKRIIP